MLESKIKPVTMHLTTWLDTTGKVVKWFDSVSLERSEPEIASFICSLCDASSYTSGNFWKGQCELSFFETG